MQLGFWQQRWQENQIGFHLPEVNEYLIRHWKSLNIQPSASVLVPLCGKSVDMAWLASEKYHVLGVECSHKAIQAFFTEQGLQASSLAVENFIRHSGNNIDILEGDFFKLDQKILSTVSAVYDRASLVALPEEMRSAYVKLLTQYLPAHVSILLVTIEYQQSDMNGPPFSVSEEEVDELFSDSFTIDILQQRDMLDDQPRFRERGLSYMHEKVYKITR